MIPIAIFCIGVNKVNKIHPLCRLDKNLYSVITPDITTDEVIITDTQISHIKKRHIKAKEWRRMLRNKKILYKRYDVK